LSWKRAALIFLVELKQTGVDLRSIDEPLAAAPLRFVAAGGDFNLALLNRKLFLLWRLEFTFGSLVSLQLNKKVKMKNYLILFLLLWFLKGYCVNSSRCS